MLSLDFALTLLAPFLGGLLVGALAALAGNAFKNALWILALVGSNWLPAEWRLLALGGLGAGFLVFSPTSWTLVAPLWGAVALVLARLERGFPFPIEWLMVCLCGGLVVAWLSQSAAKNVDPWWGLAAVLGGGMVSNQIAQGLGVACFTLGLAIFLWLRSWLNRGVSSNNEAWNERLEMVLSLACGLTFFQVYNGVRAPTNLPFDSFVALVGGVAGVLIAASGASLSRFVAPLVALLGPLALGAIWGARLELGLFLGVILGAVFGNANHTWTAILALLSMICLWPLAQELSVAPRLDRIGWVLGLGVTCVLGDILLRRRHT